MRLSTTFGLVLGLLAAAPVYAGTFELNIPIVVPGLACDDPSMLTEVQGAYKRSEAEGNQVVRKLIATPSRLYAGEGACFAGKHLHVNLLKEVGFNIFAAVGTQQGTRMYIMPGYYGGPEI